MHKILVLTLIAALSGELCSAQEFSSTGMLFASPMNNVHNSGRCQQQELFLQGNFLQGGDTPNEDERYTDLGESLLTGRFSDEEISSLFARIVKPDGDVEDLVLFNLLISINDAINYGKRTVSETGKPIIRSNKTKQTLTISPALSNELITLIRGGMANILEEIVSDCERQRVSHAFYTIIEAIPNILDDKVIRTQIVQAFTNNGAAFLDKIVLRLILESDPTHYTNCMSKLMDILTQEPNREKFLDIFKQWNRTQIINFQLFVVNFCSKKYGLDDTISWLCSNQTIDAGQLLLTHAQNLRQTVGEILAKHAGNITLLTVRDAIASCRSNSTSIPLAVMLQGSATEENLDNQQQTEENGNDDDMPPLEEFDGNFSEGTNEAQQPVSEVIGEPPSVTPTDDESTEIVSLYSEENEENVSSSSEETGEPSSVTPEEEEEEEEENPQSLNKTADKDVTDLDDDDGSKKTCCIIM